MTRAIVANSGSNTVSILDIVNNAGTIHDQIRGLTEEKTV